MKRPAPALVRRSLLVTARRLGAGAERGSARAFPASLSSTLSASRRTADRRPGAARVTLNESRCHGHRAARHLPAPRSRSRAAICCAVVPVSTRSIVLYRVTAGSASARIENRLRRIYLLPGMLPRARHPDIDPQFLGARAAWSPPAAAIARVIIPPPATIFAGLHLGGELVSSRGGF